MGIRRSGSQASCAIACIEEGIVVTGEAVDIDDLSPPPDRSDATMLFTYRSPTLAEIARPLLKESINLYGEAFMRLNADKGVFPTNDAALDGLRKRLTAWGLSDGSYQLVDGSGLSRRDAISPEAVMAVLQRMSSSSDAAPFLMALPIAGVDGSLAARMKGTAAEGQRSRQDRDDVEYSIAGWLRHRAERRAPGVRHRDQQLRGNERSSEPGDRCRLPFASPSSRANAPHRGGGGCEECPLRDLSPTRPAP